jgi:hypothetical protein
MNGGSDEQADFPVRHAAMSQGEWDGFAAVQKNLANDLRRTRFCGRVMRVGGAQALVFVDA